MPKTLEPNLTAARDTAGGFFISTGQAADMTARPDIDTMTTADDHDVASAPARRRIEDTKTKIIAALAQARRARHHRDCRCRMFQHVACNAADALWTRSMDRELDHLILQQRTR